MLYKRYEYWSNEGLTWTDWFKYEYDYQPKYQIEKGKHKLRNEYKEI